MPPEFAPEPLQPSFRHRPSSFECVTWRTERGEAYIRLSGELDTASIGRLDRALGAVADGATPVLVDLRQLTFIDGAGLGALISARARAGKAGHSVTLIRGERQFDELLESTGLEELFDTAQPRASDSPPSATAHDSRQLECPRCGLMTEPRGGHLEHEHCPRCLGSSRLEIPMSRVASS